MQPQQRENGVFTDRLLACYYGEQNLFQALSAGLPSATWMSLEVAIRGKHIGC